MKTQRILSLMHVVSWIIFLGLCIQAGAMIISFFVSLFVNPAGAQNLYMGLNLGDLYTFSIAHYVAMASSLILLLVLKAFLFYQVIRIFLQINLANPFSANVAALITRISSSSLSIGLLALLGQEHSKWLLKKGVSIQHSWSSAEFLFMAGILFIIALIFKRGIELQSENELTI